MLIDDDTPVSGSLPVVYPKNPPVNLPSCSNPPHFYAFEGIDGCGKSTLVREVARILGERNQRATILKLGRSDLTTHALPRALWLNADPVTLNLLNWISVFEQISANAERLEDGSIVLIDRFALTIKVRGLLEGLSTGFMEALEALIPRPRLMFLIDCDPAVCGQRILSGGRDITYFEAGSRVVSGPGQPMRESDPSSRHAGRDRSAELLAHLALMRTRMCEMAARYDNVRRVDNSASVARAVEEIIAWIDNDGSLAQ